MQTRLTYGTPLPPGATGTLTLTLRDPYQDASGQRAQAVITADLLPDPAGWTTVSDGTGLPVLVTAQGPGDPPGVPATAQATVTLPGRDPVTREWTVALVADAAGTLDVLARPTTEDPRVTAALTQVQDALRRVDALLRDPPAGPQGPSGPIGPQGPAGPEGPAGPQADLAPLRDELATFLADQAARHETLRGELINAARDTQATAERAVTSLNLLLPTLKGREP